MHVHLQRLHVFIYKRGPLPEDVVDGQLGTTDPLLRRNAAPPAMAGGGLIKELVGADSYLEYRKSVGKGDFS